jgi:Bacterial Ig-like domain/PKD domain
VRALRGIVTVAVTAVLAVGVSTASAEEWTGYRGGGDRNPSSSVYPSVDLSTLWTSTQKSASVGDPSSRSCVVVDENRAYAVFRDPEDIGLARLVALDRDSGQLAWQSAQYAGASVDCPVLAGDKVVVPTGANGGQATPGLRAFAAADGQPGWTTTFAGGGAVSGALSTDGTRLFGSGYAFCPTAEWSTHAAWDLATGDLEWCVPGSQTEAAPVVLPGAVIQGMRSEPGVVALDPVDGSTLWSDPGVDNGTAMAGSHGQVALSDQGSGGFGSSVSLRDATTGDLVWHHPMPGGTVAGELAIDNDRVYVSGMTFNGCALRLRAIDRQTGLASWPATVQGPSCSADIAVLGDRVASGSIVVDAATGTVVSGSILDPGMVGRAFADGTIFGWVQNADSTWSVRAVRDTRKPTVGTLAPAPGTLTTDGTPTFSFAPSDGAGTGVATATFVVDDTRYDVTGTTSFTPASALADGVHTWTVEVVDAAGNTTTSAPRSLTVDTVAPEPFEVNAPPTDGTVNTGAPEITWTPTSDITSGVDHYDVVVDGTTFVQDIPACEVTCKADLATALNDGTHQLEVVAFDAAGHRRSSGIVAFTVAAPPVAALEGSSAYALTGIPVTLDAAGSTDNGENLSYAWDVDDDGVFEVGSAQHTTRFVKVGVQTVTVRVSDGTLTDTAEVQVDVRATPPAGEIGLSINGGAYATNDPNVRVSLVWRKLDLTVLLSNDGGFGPAGNATEFATAPTLDWTLPTDRRERLPKTVWARLKGKPGAEDRDLTDDIILDTTDPVVDSASFVTSARTTAFARLAAMRIRFSATDNAAGIRGVNVTTDKSRPGTLIKVARDRSVDGVVKARVGSGPVFVRALDAAGNPSAWRRVR